MVTIRELRRQRGWTQFQLALAVGVQPQTIYLWESGRRQPQVSQMRKLGQIFELCSDEIELMPDVESDRGAGHHAQANRHAGEPGPGSDPDGRAGIRRPDQSSAPHPPS